MNLTGDAILSGLEAPGMVLVLIDESGTPGKPLPNLAEDFQVMCGLVMDSRAYGRVKDRLKIRLQELGGVEEFHATEIVNPPSDSAWRHIPVEVRLSVVQDLAAAVSENAERVYYAYSNGPQHRALLDEALTSITTEEQTVAGLHPRTRQVVALTKVFLGSLVSELVGAREPRRVALVSDPREPLSDRLKIRPLRPDVAKHLDVYERALVLTDSRSFLGLQLADFVAYVLNRIFHVAHRASIGKLTVFDTAIASAFNTLIPRLSDLLTPAGAT